MKRILLLLCAVVLIVSCASIPAYALSISDPEYTDLDEAESKQFSKAEPAVSYKAFEEIGSVVSATVAYFLSRNSYDLKDDNGNIFHVDFRHAEHDNTDWSSYPELEDPAVQLSELFAAEEDTRFRYENVLFYYHYIDHDLIDGRANGHFEIQWKDWNMMLSMHVNLKDLNLEQETFLTRLLSASAEEAAAMVKGIDIRGNMIHGLLAWLSWEGAGVLLLSATVLVLAALFLTVRMLSGVEKTGYPLSQKLTLTCYVENSRSHRKLLKVLRWIYRCYLALPVAGCLFLFLSQLEDIYKLIFIYTSAAKWLFLDIPILLFCVFGILCARKNKSVSWLCDLGGRFLSVVCIAAMVLLCSVLALKTDVKIPNIYGLKYRVPLSLGYALEIEDPEEIDRLIYTSPYSVVSYKAYGRLGTLKGATYSDKYVYPEYQYVFIDDNEMEVVVYHDAQPYTGRNERIKHYPVRRDLRVSVEEIPTLVADPDYRFQCHGVSFRYDDGRLSLVARYVGNMLITVWFSGDKGVSLENDTFYTQLLSATPQKAAAMVKSLPVRLFTVPQLSWEGAAVLQPVFSLLIPTAVYFTVRWLFGLGKTKEELQLALGSLSRSQKLTLDGYVENIPGDQKRLRILRRIYWGYLMYPAGAYILLLVSWFQPVYRTIFAYVCLAKLVLLDIPVLLYCAFLTLRNWKNANGICSTVTSREDGSELT